MKNMNAQCRSVAATLSVVLILGCGSSNSAAPPDFSELSPKIMHALDSIKSYEMTASYSERVKGAKALVFRMKSDSLSTLRFKSPNLLYISATNTTTRGSKAVQTFTIYTTYDGKQQKCRTIVATNGKSKTNSVMLDLSINSPDQPFNGWNLKGFGLSEGTDYIGTIRGMLLYWDFVSGGQKRDIAEFRGTFNVVKCTAALAKTMSAEDAKTFAQITERMMKELRLRVDTKTHLVVGYTQIDTLAERTCRFENIDLNPDLDDEVFSFRSLPEENFSDVTDTIKKSRERSRKRLAPNKPDAGDGK